MTDEHRWWQASTWNSTPVNQSPISQSATIYWSPVLAKNTDLGISCLNSKSKFSKPQWLILGKVPRSFLALIPIVLWGTYCMEPGGLCGDRCDVIGSVIVRVSWYCCFVVVTLTVVAMGIVEVQTISGWSKFSTSILFTWLLYGVEWIK